MKKITIILACVLVAMISCTKSKEVHPETGDGNDEIVTVGMTDVQVEYTRTDHAELNKVGFHYCPADANGNAQQFEVAEMTKKETFFELILDNLLSDTLYWYYYELFPIGGETANTVQKTFHTQPFDVPTPPTPPFAELPTVVTVDVSEITSNSAQCYGEVTNDGGSEVTERGFCWSVNANPTLEFNHIAAGSGMGEFTATISGMEPTTVYHFRAYATNEAGTAYGMDKEFTTLSGGGGSGNAPTGAIDGLFSINENGDQVYFSQGNLQYQASTNTWRFAENQWDYVGTQTPDSYGHFGGTINGSDNASISQFYDGWIDLFGWGTSGWDCGNTFYHPWDATNEINIDRLYGPPGQYDLTGLYSHSDWGVHNAISNGGNQSELWRTLTNDEWEYIIWYRQTPSEALFVKARVANENGLILLPDNWNSDVYALYNVNLSNAGYYSNQISSAAWVNSFQANGAVFLPAAGFRIEDCIVRDVSLIGRYWSASYDQFSSAYGELISNDHIYNFTFVRSCGCSVRLVRDAN